MGNLFGGSKYTGFVSADESIPGVGVPQAAYLDEDPSTFRGRVSGGSFTTPPCLYRHFDGVCVAGIGFFGKHYQVSTCSERHQCYHACLNAR